MWRVVCSRAFPVLFVFKYSQGATKHKYFPEQSERDAHDHRYKKNITYNTSFAFHRASERGHSSTGEGLKHELGTPSAYLGGSGEKGLSG